MWPLILDLDSSSSHFKFQAPGGRTGGIPACGGCS